MHWQKNSSSMYYTMFFLISVTSPQSLGTAIKSEAANESVYKKSF